MRLLVLTVVCRGKVYRRLTKRSIDHNLHSDLGRRRNGVVGVGLESRVHAALERLARLGEAGLGDGVVVGEEFEDDGVTDGDGELVRLVGETTGATNLDSVAGTRANHGSSLAVLDGGGGAVLSSNGSRLLSSNDSLGNSDLVVDVGSLGAVSGVVPDDDDLGASSLGDTRALHATESGGGASIELTTGNLLGKSHRRQAQSNCR